MPHALVQDFILFIIIKQKSIEIWKKRLVGYCLKVVWFVSGHSDYVNFDNCKSEFDEFPFKFYSLLLDYFKVKYSGQFWTASPSEMAYFIKNLNPVNSKVIKS